MNPYPCLMSRVGWTLEKGSEEVTQWFLLSDRSPVFKVEGYIDERTAIGTEVLLLNLKSFEDEFLVACNVFTRGDSRRKRCALKWRGLHIHSIRDEDEKWKG